AGHQLGAGLAELEARRLAAHVGGAHVGLGEEALDGSDDGGAGFLVAEVIQHHGAGPDLADRVGDALAGDVGRAAVHRLEHGGERALGIDIAAGGDGDGAGGGGAVVGENVPEQVGDDDHV